MENFIEKFEDINLDEFKGFNVKQKSPREIDLFKKEKTGNITEEEKGELYGLRVFPNNPRGQELRKKEHLGFLTPEEKEEFRRLCQLKKRAETMSPELQKLWERTEANDPNIEQVSMNQGKSIEVLPDDEQEKVIWTYGLGGCFGTLVFSEDENGRKTAILTHFGPLSISANVNELRKLIRLNSAMKASKYQQSILVWGGAEGYGQSPQAKQREWETEQQQKANMLITAIKAELGQYVNIKMELYSTLQDAVAKNQGTLIVRIPPNGQATYKTWFSQGQLGKTDQDRTEEMKEKLN
ncbi:MAG: hypothetical protein C0412_16655 [Flavobacterium sp.]|nr:hypothetical protein [Flavobacterium sp.]